MFKTDFLATCCPRLKPRWWSVRPRVISTEGGGPLSSISGTAAAEGFCFGQWRFGVLPAAGFYNSCFRFCFNSVYFEREAGL